MFAGTHVPRVFDNDSGFIVDSIIAGGAFRLEDHYDARPGTFIVEMCQNQLHSCDRKSGEGGSLSQNYEVGPGCTPIVKTLFIIAGGGVFWLCQNYGTSSYNKQDNTIRFLFQNQRHDYKQHQ